MVEAIIAGIITTVVGGVIVLYYQKVMMERAEAAKRRAEQQSRATSTIEKQKEDEAIRLHNQQLVEQLKGDWFEQFINLYVIPVKLRGESRGPTTEQLTIFEIAARFAQSPIAILGEPGAGKSTLAKMLAINYAQNGPRIPIFISMGLYSGQNNLIDMSSTPIDDWIIDRLLRAGRFLIIFDGFNEVDLDLRAHAARSIVDFISKHSKNQFVITCRTAEYPTYLRTEVRRFEILRINPDIVHEYLVKILGSVVGEDIYVRLPARVRDLCRNPLMLTMLTYLYQGDEQPEEVPNSKIALYEEFVYHLHDREAKIHSLKLPQTFHEEFLANLAMKMENRHVSIKRSTAEEWITEFYRAQYQGSGLNIITVLHEVLDLPPMKASAPARQANVEVSFMHQSFQEFYTARELQARYNRGNIGLQGLIAYASPTNYHWWETLTLLVGMMDDATPLIRMIKKQAELVADTQADQRIFGLVARCIRESKHVHPAEVDDVIIRTLLAFKFGKVAFDYDLHYALKLIRPEQRSKDFPPRLIADIDWWLDKYTRVTAAPLDNSIPVDGLLQYLDSDDEGLVIEALFTLREHPDRSKSAPHLIEKLRRCTGTIREQLVITLGYLGADAGAGVESLIEIVRNPEETRWARAYALAALGKIGDVRAVPAMIDFLLDHNNLYRDSASWALQILAKQYRDNTTLWTQLKKVYITALLSETDDVAGRYAKGNIVYSLGELGATEYVEDIIKWLKTEKDPYVIEDGVQALGRLQDPRAVEIVLEHLSSDDPVVRMTVVDALASILAVTPQISDAAAHLRPLLSDKSALVREHAGEAFQKIEAVLAKTNSKIEAA